MYADVNLRKRPRGAMAHKWVLLQRRWDDAAKFVAVVPVGGRRSGASGRGDLRVRGVVAAVLGEVPLEESAETRAVCAWPTLCV